MKKLAPMLTVGALVLGGCGGSGVSAQNHRDFVAGCSSGQPTAACECIFKQLTIKQGVNSDGKLKALDDKLQIAKRTRNAAALPPEMRNAVLACRSLIRR